MYKDRTLLLTSLFWAAHKNFRSACLKLRLSRLFNFILETIVNSIRICIKGFMEKKNGQYYRENREVESLANCSGLLCWGEIKHMSEVRETAHNKQLKFKLSIKNCISIPLNTFKLLAQKCTGSCQLSALSGGWKLNSIIHQHKDEQQIEILPFAALILLCNFSALCSFIFKTN